MNSYAAALTRTAPAGAPNTVAGEHFLLGRGPWGEFVARYTEAELAAVFTPADRTALAAGKQVWHGKAVWTDMVVHTRAAIA